VQQVEDTVGRLLLAGAAAGHAEATRSRCAVQVLGERFCVGLGALLYFGRLGNKGIL